MIDAAQIGKTVRDSVHRITGIPGSEILDSSRYREDLGLDSLSALEVVVDIEFAFKIKVPEERIQNIKTVEDTIKTVQEYLAAVRT
jgi:acyl carrier protein